MKLKLIPILLLATVFPVRSASAQEDDVAVVVNPDNVARSLTTSELRKLFAGEKRSWPGGQPVRLFTRAPGTREHGALLKLLGLSEGEYKRYWTERVFRGEDQEEPTVLPSNGMQKEAVIAFPGGIALIVASDVKAGIKVLKVDGYSPGEVGYPLH